MDIFIDITKEYLIQGLQSGNALKSLRKKVGTDGTIRVFFRQFNSGTGLYEQYEFTGNWTFKFTAKALGKYEGDAVIFTDDWTPPAGDDEFYTINPSFNTNPLRTLLNLDGTENNDKPSVTLNLEIEWRYEDSDPVRVYKSRAVQLIVDNAVNQGDEGLPEDPGPDYLTITQGDARYLRRASQEGLVNLTGGSESKAIVFSPAFDVPPTSVEVHLMIPSGGSIFLVAPDHSTITETGFTAVFGASVPGSGTYKLLWKAHE
jgi:hypothetical protein